MEHNFTEDQVKMLKEIMERTDLGESNISMEIEDCLEDFKRNEEPQVIAKITTDNPALNYDIVNTDKPVEKLNGFYVPYDKMDYRIPRDDSAIRRGFKEDMPISFLSIKDGELEKGKEWYLSQFPKLPNEIAELLARYNWGDLKYQTKKKIKNDRKKALKKGKKYEPLSNMEVKQGKFDVSFD